jgi:hypothetical protein
LANGTIANIDASKNPELAVALRGSGSQFGRCLTNKTRYIFKVGH